MMQSTHLTTETVLYFTSRDFIIPIIMLRILRNFVLVSVFSFYSGAPAQANEVLSRLILNLNWCDGLLADAVSLDKVTFSSRILSETRILRFKKDYEGIEINEGEEGEMIIDFTVLTETQKIALVTDLLFLKQNPRIPVENQSSQLANYDPKNDSQTHLLKWARKLLDSPNTDARGLFITGNPGVGKSHISIAVVKECIVRGDRAVFLQGGSFRLTDSEIAQYNVFIFDDFNDGYQTIADTFLRAVIHVHNHGGKIFVTSNSTFDKLMNEIFGTRRAERPRFEDRMGAMFKQLSIEGTSNRQVTRWYEEED